jgi:hypothetical protein
MEVFKYDDGENLITLYGDGSNSIFIQSYQINSGKLFTILLNKAFLDLEKLGYTTHRQHVSKIDYENIMTKKPEWKLICIEDDGAYCCECDIKFASSLIIEAFMSI